MLTDAVGLDHRDGPTGGGEQPTIGDRLPAPYSVDPATVIEWRERLAELGAALKALTPIYREALLGEGAASAKPRYHARRRVQQLLEQGAAAATRVDGRLYGENKIALARGLVASGKSLHEAGAAVDATHTTILDGCATRPDRARRDGETRL